MNPDSHEIFDRAHEAMNLEQMMQAIGDGEYVGKSRVCPFCNDKKKRWGTVKTGNGLIVGKCFAPDCETGGRALTQIGYLSMRQNIPRNKAARAFLEMAVPHLIAEQEEARKKNAPSTPEPESDAPAPLPELPQFSAEHGPWHALFTTLAPLMNPDDVKALGKKRGLTPETIRLAGICPSREELEGYVHSASATFTDSELLECGIKRRDDSGRVYFSGKLKGWGPTGRKVANKTTGRMEMEYGADVNPPLIPCFDERGICTYMRPHKDYITGLRDETEALDREFFNLDADEDEDAHEVPPCGAHVYLPPRFLENLRAWDGLCVITEGEFKAMAADQCGIACMAVPGISFIRNPAFRTELIALIDTYRIEHVVVIFDNEVKDDPAFPDKYKSDPEKQFDTQFYAEYTMRNLRPVLYGRGGTARVGWLPDRFRKNGKADFDGILAHFTNAEGFKDGTEKARKVFERCIEKATEHPEKLKQSPGEDDLFPSRGRRIIENRMARVEHKPALAFGGHRERQLAMQLAKRDMTIEDSQHRHAVDKVLSDALLAVVGSYYTRKKVDKDAADELRMLKAETEGLIKAERERDKANRNMEVLRSLYAKRAAINERLLGMPEPKSNFVMRCDYAMKTNGPQEFLVRVMRQGSREWSPLIVIKPKDVANPRDMKEWAMGHGNCNFTGAIHELDALRTDMLVQSYRREIHKIQSVGFHPDSGMWLFGDSAFADDKANPDGRSDIILPDANGTFWDKQGVGYFADASQDDGTSSFTLGVPRMMRVGSGADHSSLFEEGELGDQMLSFLHDLRDSHSAKRMGVELDTAGRVMRETESVWQLGAKMQSREVTPSIDDLLANASGTIPMIDGAVRKEVPLRDLMERRLAGHILREMANDYKAAIGDYDAWLLIGGLLGSYAAPELVRNYNCHPGVAVFGPAGSGKSERLKMLTRIQGWSEQKMDLNSNATPIGISRTLAQYSGVSPFFDEFRRTNPNAETYQNIMRQASDRGVSAKGNIKNLTSTTAVTFRTTPLVAGENIFDDPATRTRFIAVQIQKARRDNPLAEAAYSRIKSARYHYYHVGRYALTWRRKFVSEFLTYLDKFLKDNTESISHDRVRLATGTGFAAFKAMAVMTGVYDQSQDAAFQAYAVQHGQRSSSDISDDTFRNTFWTDITNMVLNRESSIRIPRCFFDTGVEEHDIDPAKPELGKRKVTVLFIAANAIYPIWEEFCKRRGREATMSLQNLRDEMAREKYWIENKGGKGSVQHRFPVEGDDEQGGGRTKKMRCWAIIADDAPFASDLFSALGEEDPST